MRSGGKVKMAGLWCTYSGQLNVFLFPIHQWVLVPVFMVRGLCRWGSTRILKKESGNGVPGQERLVQLKVGISAGEERTW